MSLIWEKVKTWELVLTALPALDLALGSPQGAPQTALRGLSLKVAGSGEWVPGPPRWDRETSVVKVWAWSLWGSVSSSLHAAPAGHHRHG